MWASNIDFQDEATYDSHIEVDFTVGYTVALGERTETTFKFVYFMYPDADAPAGFPSYDYYELSGSLTRQFGSLSFTGEIAWSPEFFGEVGEAYAFTGGVALPLRDSLWFFDGGVEASGHVGEQWYDDPTLVDYTFYDLGVSATAGRFTLDVRYVGTELDNADCGGFDWCDETVAVTGTIAFGG